VQRLSIYLRELERLASQDRATVSSRHLGTASGATDAQVRKDLGFIGHAGQPGVGYVIEDLIGAIREAIGVHRAWRAAIVGAGNIGRALTAYRRFQEEGFVIAAVFDQSSAVVGRQVAGMPVQPMEAMPRAIRDGAIDIGIIAVPPEQAQRVADALVAAGVRGILNFAPTRLQVADRVATVDVDFRAALERLAMEVSERSGAGRERRGA
jgi:redox-sensing transcriptional repressor